MMKRFSMAILSLVIMFGAVSVSNAQSFGGRMSTRDKVKWIGGGAAAGAVIGGLLNGRKGAAIGAVVGGAAGAGTVYVKGRRDEERYGRYYENGRYYDNGRYNNSRYYENSRYYDNGRYNNSRFRNISRFDSRGRRCN
jgi:hypothetical protein